MRRRRVANSRKVLEQIQTLRSLSGTTEKKKFLKVALEEELFRQVITWALDPMITFGEKDLRAGVGVSTVNGARPGTLFEFNVMLAHKFEPDKITYPVYVEPKYDGMRLIAITDADSTDFYTRTGKSVTTVSIDTQLALQDLYAQGTDIWRPKEKMVFDGELMGESFKETMEQARKKDGSFENGT